VPQATVDVLTRIYRHYRQYLHHRSLDGQGGVIAADELTNERSTIIEIWREAMETVGPAMLPDRPRGSAPPL